MALGVLNSESCRISMEIHLFYEFAFFDSWTRLFVKRKYVKIYESLEVFGLIPHNRMRF